MKETFKVEYVYPFDSMKKGVTNIIVTVETNGGLQDALLKANEALTPEMLKTLKCNNIYKV